MGSRLVQKLIFRKGGFEVFLDGPLRLIISIYHVLMPVKQLLDLGFKITRKVQLDGNLVRTSIRADQILNV